MYDVIVVGARCAGASTAMSLARAGLRVLLLDRATFPRDTLSTHYIHQPGVIRLDRWGLLDAVRASGCPAITSGVNGIGTERIRGWAPTTNGIGAAYAPRRQVLDMILTEAAVRSGADFRDGCAMEDLLWSGERVSGVSCRTPDGARARESARLVVGADGMRSAVARLTGATEYSLHPRMTCVYYTYWADVPACFEIYHDAGRAVGAVPTHDNLTMVSAYFSQSEFAQVRRDPLGAYLAAVRTTAPELYERLAGRRPAECLRGTGDQRNFFRTATGPGWALVGDAGHHRDSITAQGITNAFQQAELLTESLLTDADDFDAGLRQFADRRDDALMPSYQATLRLAQLRSNSSADELVRAMERSPELASRYFGLVAGVVTPEDFTTFANQIDVEPLPAHTPHPASRE